MIELLHMHKENERQREPTQLAFDILTPRPINVEAINVVKTLSHMTDNYAV